jgi:hypothetical protein
VWIKQARLFTFQVRFKTTHKIIDYFIGFGDPGLTFISKVAISGHFSLASLSTHKILCLGKNNLLLFPHQVKCVVFKKLRLNKRPFDDLIFHI